MTRILIRIALFAALVFGQAAAVPVGAPIPEAGTDSIISCESAPVPDAHGVSIGSALRLHRTDDLAAVAADCAGAVSRL